MRKLCKIGGYLGLALVLVALLAYLARNPLRDALARMASARVSQSLQGALTIGSLRGSLLTSLVLQDVVLRDGPQVVAQIETVRLAYTPWSLVQGQLTIHAVDIVRPHMTLVQEADGQWNIARLLSPRQAEVPPVPEKSAGGGLPFAITLADLQLRDGRIAVRTPSLPGVQHLSGLGLRLDGQIDRQGLRLRVRALSARATPADVEIQSLRASLQGLPGAMRLDDVHLQTRGTLITAAGVLPGGRRAADLEVRMQPFDMAELGRLLGRETFHGLLQLTVKAAGPPEALQVHGQLSAAQGKIDLQSEIDLAATPLRYRGTLDMAKVNLEALLGQPDLQSDIGLRLHFTGAGVSLGTLQGQVQLDVEPSHVGNITVRPSHIRLDVQQQRVHVQRFDLDTSAAQITAAGGVDITGSSDLHYEIVADAADLRQVLGLQELGGEIRVRGQVGGELTAINAHGTVRAKNLRYQKNHVQAVEITYEGSNLGAQPQIQARLLAQQAQAATLAVERIELQATYQGETRQVRFVADVRQSATYAGKMRGNLTLAPASQHVLLEDLQIQLADRAWQAAEPVAVAFGAGRLHLQQFRLLHDDESVELSGAVDGENLQDLRLRARRIDLTFLRHLLHLPAVVDGRATLDMQVAGTLAEPRVHGDVLLQPRQQARLPFERVHATLTYAQKQLQSDVRVQQRKREVLAMQLQLPVDMALTAMPLEQRLGAAPVALHVDVQRPDVAALHDWLPALAGFSGTLQGTVAARGTYTALDVETDLRFEQFGIRDVVAGIKAPLRLTGKLVTAASQPELIRALQQGKLALQVQQLELRVPTLQGQLPGRETAPQPLHVQNIVAQADGRWTAAGLHATLHALRLRAQAFGLPRTDLTVAARLTPAALALTRFAVRTPQSQIQGQGKLAWREQHVELRLNIPRLQLDEFVRTWPSTLPPDVRGTVEVEGSLQAPRLQARMQYAAAQVTAAVRAELQEHLPRYAATLRVDALEAARLLPGAQGQLQALLRLQGTGFAGEQRQADLDLRLDSSAFSLAPGLTAHLQASLAGNAVRLQQLHIQSLPATVTATGRLSADHQVALDYTVTLGDLQALREAFGLALQAQGRIAGKVGGTLAALQTQGTVALDELAYAGLQAKTMRAAFSATHLPAQPRGTIQAQILDLQGPSLPPSSLNLQGSYEAAAGAVQVTMTAGPYAQSELQGNVMLQDGLQLTLERLRLQHQALVWENAAPIEISRDAQGIMHLQRLLLQSGDQALQVQGTFDPQGAIAAQVRVQRLQMQPLVGVFLPAASVPQGQLDLDLTLSGSLTRPLAHGKLALTALQWQDRQVGDVHALLDFADNTVRTDLRWQEAEQEMLRIHGTLSIGGEGALALRVQASAVDLERLAPLHRAMLHSAGMLYLDLHLSGTVQQPQVHGSLELRDGALQLAVTGERYRDIQLRVAFTGDRAQIERLHVGSRRGALQVSGWLQAAGLTLKQLDLSLQAEDFTAMHSSALETVVSAALTARGSLEEMAVAGNITVPRLRFRLRGKLGGGPADVDPADLTVEGVYGGVRDQAARAEAQASRPRKNVPLPFLRTDVTVDIPGNAWVQGPSTAVEMRGTVRVMKALQEPFVLSGSVATVRGFAGFYGKKFVLQKGEVTFTGATEIDPFVDVTATHEVSDYVVTIHVGGKTTQPQLTLSSDPDLPQADIVSLLVVGKTTDRLTRSERSSVSGQAQNVIGGLAANELEKTLGGTLGLDTVEISGGETLGTGSVAVGRYVTQDIFLSYERQLGEKGGNKVGVEYSINRRLKLKGSSSDVGESAVDLFWRLDY